ncbi:MAG: phage tail sheath subtilisin-like domain-containing protein [Pseudomonadota bacterium]
MAELSYPGVYSTEVDSQNRTVQGAGTSVVGFVGSAPKAPLNQAIACNSWTQFVERAVGEVDEKTKSTDLIRAVYGFYQNGGRRCFVVNVGDKGALTGGAGKKAGLDCLDMDEIALIAAPGRTDPLAHDAIITFCEKREDKFGILDLPSGDDVTLEHLAKAVELTAGKDGEMTPSGGARARQSERGYAGCYFPNLLCRDPIHPKQIVSTPPSGAIAGIYNRVDASEGVHRAPANMVVRGALGVTRAVSKIEQGELNKNSVNCIRTISNAVRVWGARTLSDPSSDVRYINVRRTMIFLRKSLADYLAFATFLPNGPELWGAMKFSIGNFLTAQWRSGALVGNSPEQAFFVNISHENNPPAQILEGRLNVDVGVAISRPAEFIVFRISQWTGAEGEGEG